MEDRRDHQTGRVALLTFALLALAGHAAGQAGPEGPYEPWNPTIDVSSGPDAVVVESEVSGSVPGGSGASGGGGGGGSGCWLEATNLGDSLSEEFWDRGADEFPYFLYCDGEMVGLVWRAIDDDSEAAPAPESPEEVAMSMRDRIPIPNVTVKVNPGRGLVGVESWFWVEGYDGTPITESTNAFGSQVDVEARAERYEWSFGDSKGLVTKSLGRKYPEPSDVRHVYERSSLGHPDGYRVEVGFFFSVRYRVNGGGWIDLPGIERAAQALYPVRESQAVVRQ